MRLIDVFEQQFVPLRGRSRSHDTLRMYRHSIKAFSEHLGHAATLDDFNDLAVAGYLAAYAPGRSPHTVERERVTLLALWRWCFHRRMLDRWPDIEPTKCPKRIPEAWTSEQIARLFAACSRAPGMVGDVRACDWWTCLHWIAWDTGERIGAIMAIRRADVTLSESRGNSVICRAESRKGGRADRFYQVSTETAAAIRIVMQQTRDELLLPWPYSETCLWRLYPQILRMAGLPTDAKSKFHRLRKSVASHLVAAGENATRALDHQNAKTTQAYIDPRIAKQKPIYETLFRPGGA